MARVAIEAGKMEPVSMSVKPVTYKRRAASIYVKPIVLDLASKNDVWE